MKFGLKDRIAYIFDSIKFLLNKAFASRINILIAIISILLFVIVVRLFYLQIIKTDYYSENFTQKAQKVITTEAARGNIYDRNGNLLAYNEISYSVVMTDEIPSSDERGDILNGIIYRTINLIESYGDKIIDDFNIELNSSGEYAFKTSPVTKQKTFLINIFGGTSEDLKEKGYDQYSAKELMEYLCDRYGISDTYSKEDKLKIATVRYALSLTAYQKYVYTTIADNINEKTMAAILESTDDMTGIEVKEKYKRVYNYAEYFAHIIGYTGEISAEELEEYNLENDNNITYSTGDIVGKSGIEQTYDSYLQGTKGTKTVFVDSTGNILDVIGETKSNSGNDVTLTLDVNLQMAAYNILEKKLAACLINKIVDYDYSATEKSTYVYIPIKDVYYKLLVNVIDFTEFSREGASEREKATLAAFKTKKKAVIKEISNQLTDPNALPGNSLSDDSNEYLYYIYDLLGEEGILNKDLIDTSDSVYKAWISDEVSLREFLQHAIAENWIDVAQIDSSKKYSVSDEIYDAIVENILTLLDEDLGFAKKIYYYMIYAEELNPYDICLMLYDQGKIEQDDLYYELVYKTMYTYDYVIAEIENLVLTPAMLALDPCSGALSITDVDTGKVLALVSYPTYDNNKLSGTVDSDYWYELNNNDSQPLFNYATSALTAPGSTFKLCTSVAALAEGYITPETIIHDEVYFTEITPSPKCYIAPYSHGDCNVSTALMDSCNYFFFQIGYNMGLDQYGEYNSAQALEIIEKYAVSLGLGEKSGVEISERSPRVSTTDSVRTAIGQGTNGYATVHMNRYVNTIAGSGKNYQLSLLDKIVASDGKIVLEVEPVLTNTVSLDKESWDAIHYGMKLVTESGTASTFFTDLTATTVAGKTGTAEENVYRSNHTAFVGYAPYENPEISFACMIRNSDSTSYPGAVVSEVLQYYYGQITLEDVFNSPVGQGISGFHSE